MFRRRTTDDSVAAQLASATDRATGGSHAVDPDTVKRAAAVTAGKGRPTPKRSDAEASRATRLNPPKDRKEALKLQREQAKEARAKNRAALLSGDDRYLTSRDRGAVRKFVRNWVDARRTVGEYFLIIGLVIVLLSLFNNATLQSYAISAWLVAIILIVGEAFWLTSKLKRDLAARFPEDKGPYEGRKGATFYGIMRAFQLRRLRMPKPQVKVGDPV